MHRIKLSGVAPSIGVFLLTLLLAWQGTPSSHATTVVIHERIFYALTAGNALLTFDVHTPGVINHTAALVGLRPGESVLAVDVRPSTGGLYGVGSSGRLYVIDPVTGVAAQVGSGPFEAALSGAEFGMDFDPVTEVIHLVSDADQNLRIDPDTGSLAGQGTALAYAPGDPNAGANPNVVGINYLTTFERGEATTALYGIDSHLDALVVLDDPDSGRLRTLGPLGGDVPETVGFGNSPSGSLPFAVMRRAGERNPVIFLLHVAPTFPPGSPRAEALGVLGTTETIRGLAVANHSGTFQFGRESYRVVEDAAAVPITVTRKGDTSRAATVDYVVRCGPQTLVRCEADRAASELSDFTDAIGTLRFAPGETTRTFSVLVNEDAIVEHDGEKEGEVVTFSLQNPTGNFSLGVPRVATLLVVDDDDPVSSAVNTIDDASAFVHQHYHDFLNRAPDRAGLQFWTSQIASCGADAACVELKRVNVSAAFFLSIEFQETGYLVYLAHQAAFNSGRSLRRQAFLYDTARVGDGVVVGADGWEARLEANKRAYFESFVLQPEFVAKYPDALSAAQFVQLLNANAGGLLGPAERGELARRLGGGQLNRAQVLRAIVENPSFRQREFNRAFVLMQYFGYLRRNPNEGPDTNFDGYFFWLSKLDEFQGNFIRAEMVKAFIVSIEFRRRFGQ